MVDCRVAQLAGKLCKPGTNTRARESRESPQWPQEMLSENVLAQGCQEWGFSRTSALLASNQWHGLRRLLDRAGPPANAGIDNATLHALGGWPYIRFTTTIILGRAQQLVVDVSSRE